MGRSWFDRETRGSLLDNTDYDHDVEEAASIGRSVNEVAVKRDRAAHGLTVDGWSLIWRSAVVDRASCRVEHATPGHRSGKDRPAGFPAPAGAAASASSHRLLRRCDHVLGAAAVSRRYRRPSRCAHTRGRPTRRWNRCRASAASQAARSYPRRASARPRHEQLADRLGSDRDRRE
jgi:hypothetical protein